MSMMLASDAASLSKSMVIFCGPGSCAVRASGHARMLRPKGECQKRKPTPCAF